jgi:hypothetical protein
MMNCAHRVEKLPLRGIGFTPRHATNRTGSTPLTQPTGELAGRFFLAPGLSGEGEAPLRPPRDSGRAERRDPGAGDTPPLRTCSR